MASFSIGPFHRAKFAPPLDSSRRFLLRQEISSVKVCAVSGILKVSFAHSLLVPTLSPLTSTSLAQQDAQVTVILAQMHQSVVFALQGIF
jgi:hypothetical protein